MPGRFDEVEPTPPSILFGDAGLVLDGGDLTIELIPTPGHSDDHVVALHPASSTSCWPATRPRCRSRTSTRRRGLVRARASLERLADARRALRAAVPRRHHRSGRAGAQPGLARRRRWPIRSCRTRTRWSGSATAATTCSRCTGASTPTPAGRRRSASRSPEPVGHRGEADEPHHHDGGQHDREERVHDTALPARRRRRGDVEDAERDGRGVRRLAGRRRAPPGRSRRPALPRRSTPRARRCRHGRTTSRGTRVPRRTSRRARRRTSRRARTWPRRDSIPFRPFAEVSNLQR